METMPKSVLNSHKWFESLSGSIVALYNNEFKNLATTLLYKTLNELLIANFKVWSYEDEARRKDLPDKEIANLKRNIDRDNQRRNDLIDTIDAILKQDIENELNKLCLHFSQKLDRAKLIKVIGKVTKSEVSRKTIHDPRVITLSKAYQHKKRKFIKKHAKYIFDCIFNINPQLYRYFD